MGSGLLFCPTCGNLLLVEENEGASNIFACQTCPYIYHIDKKFTKSVALKKKEVEPVLGGDEEWKGYPQATDAHCEKCGCERVLYREIQIRSADEPASLFFFCTNCRKTWREG